MIDELLELVGLWVLLYFVIRKRRRNNRWRNRRWWVRPIKQSRDFYGAHSTLWQELKQDETMFFRYTRMDVQTFHHVLDMVSPYLLKNHPRALNPELRLAITLRYLATGDQILSIALAYRIGESTARLKIQEVCDVLVRVLQPVYLAKPTVEEWRDIAGSFLEEWNFSNCVGAFDGKHVLVQAPPNSGSLYFNYKKTFSVVLLAACDANYKFTLVQVGDMGSNSDAGIFAESLIGHQLREAQLDLPRGNAQLPGSHVRTPCFFVGDDAFPLSMTMMKPYPGRGLGEARRIFNYRLSRARRAIENTFGILVSKWRIFRKPITLHPDAVDEVILATVCLHNFLKARDQVLAPAARRYCPPHFTDWEDENGAIQPGGWRQMQGSCFENIPAGPLRNAPENAVALRDTLTEYFLTPEGEVPWQYEYIRYRNRAQED